jgi:hypothetical protein
MQRKTLLSLACVVLFLVAAVPTDASSGRSPISAPGSGAVASHMPLAPDSTRPGGLPSGWSYWNQTIYWENYSLQYYPGTRYFFPGVNMFDALVVSNQIPDGQMTAYYVNASGHLLSYDLETGAYRTLGPWPTNLSSYDTPAMVQGFQGWNGTLTALYEMGSNSNGYVDVEWYSIANGSFYWANTTIDETTSATNVDLGVLNTTGWFFYTNNAESTVDLFNIFSHQLATASAPALPAWNSGVYVPGADQVVEDVDDTSNSTLEVRAFNATYSGGSAPTIHIVTRWGGTISGADEENMPYFFNVSGSKTTLWGLGGGGNPNRNMVISLYKNMVQDGSPTTTDTGNLGTTDPAAYAYWDDSQYFFNGYNPAVGTGSQGPFIDPLNDSGIFASGGSNATWFNTFLHGYDFGFGGGPWVNSWQFIGPPAGWVNAILDNGTSSARSCGTVCTLMLYWLPGHTGEFSSPPLPVSSVSGMSLSSSSIQWTWTQSPSPGILNDTLYLYTGSTCTSPIDQSSGGGPLTTHTSTGLRGGTAYSFAVVAWNASGESTFSDCAAATTFPGVPPAPTSLAVTGANLSSLTLMWTNPPPPSSFSNISLSYGTSAESLTTVISVGTVAAATVTGLLSGTLYYVQVTAWNGTVPSVGSLEASGSTLYRAPSTPSGLHQTDNTTTTIQVAWTNPAPGTFTNITIYYHRANIGIESSISAATATTVSLTGLTPGSAYLIAVGAWNVTAASSVSPYLQAWTTGSPTRAPGSPSGLHVTNVSATSISLAWILPAAGFDNVSLEYRLEGTGSTNTTLSLGGRFSSFTLAALAPDSTYLFSVATWNLTIGSGYLPFINGTTASNATTPGGGSGCGELCNPWLLVAGGLAIGVVVGAAGTALVVRWRHRLPPS